MSSVYTHAGLRPLGFSRVDEPRGSVSRHHVDAVVLAGALGHLDADTVADLRGFNGRVLELHGRHLLGEVRRVAGDPNVVADVELARGDLHDGDLGLAEVVRHGSYELLPHHVLLSAPSSTAGLPKACPTWRLQTRQRRVAGCRREGSWSCSIRSS